MTQVNSEIKLNGALPSPHDDRDYIWDNMSRAGVGLQLAKPLPLEFSLVPYCTPVKNQGPTSTCAAQACATIREVQERIEHGVFKEPLSPSFVYAHRMNKPSEGMYGRDAMDILRARGICLETTCPFSTRKEPKITSTMLKEAKLRITKNYARVTTIEGAKMALIQNGPLLILFPTYSSNAKFWLPEKVNDVMEGGHAVTIVGWTKEGFIIRNSWGTGWANKGYTIFPFVEKGHEWEIWSCVDDKTIYLPAKLKATLPDFRPSFIKRMGASLKKCFGCGPVEHVD